MTKDKREIVAREQGNTIPFQCPALTETNYTTWFIMIETVLRAYGHWNAITEDEVYEKKNYTTKGIIFQTLSENVLLQVAKHNNAKDVWESIKVRYIGAERVQKARLKILRNELEILKMNDNESINDFAGKINGIVAKFKSLGSSIEEEMIVRKFLNSVPKKYLPIVAPIEQYSDLETMPFEEAIRKVKAYEERLQSLEVNDGEHSQLMLASDQKYCESSGRERGRRRNFDRGVRGRGSGRGRGDKSTGSMQVLQGVEFEVEPQEDHTFEVEPHRNVNHVDGSQEVQTQDLMDYQLARDREQHLAYELFRYREDTIKAAFVVAAVEKNYACESLTFNNTVTCEVISKWEAGLKDDMGARSDVDKSGYTLRVSQSRFYNGKLVQTLLEGHFILSLKGNLSRDCDVEKNVKWSYIFAVGSRVCTILDIAFVDVDMLDKFDRGLQTDVAKHKNAKDVWELIKVWYIGAERVQKARLKILRNELEILKMNDNESINDFAGKISGIVAKFKSLGSSLEEEVIVRKFLNSVPKKYLPTVAPIEQYSDLETMPFEEAAGRVKSYEERLQSLEANDGEHGQLMLASDQKYYESSGCERGCGKNFNRGVRGRGRGRGRGDKSGV
nr:zinc finger, CCHC-type [Tanacetum cinerariifolium]